MPLELLVPYAEKDEVKSLGGLWLPERKTWVVPDHIRDIDPFKTWIDYREGCIARKPYLLCLSKTKCWKCGKETPMIALGAKNYYAFEEQSWLKSKEPTLFSSVLTMSPPIRDWLGYHYPSFKIMYSYTIKSSYYGNTCTSCGRLQGDFFHHEEPGGAFFPDPYGNQPITARFKNIDLELDYHIMADFGGMAYDDLFFPECKR
jgi:hypothetical protein